MRLPRFDPSEIAIDFLMRHNGADPRTGTEGAP